MLQKNNMIKTTLFNAAIFVFTLLISTAGTVVHSQEKAIPRDLQSALTGIARDRLVAEIEKLPKISDEGKYEVKQDLVGGWLGKQINSVTSARYIVAWRVEPRSPRQRIVLNITKATWEPVPRANNQWRLKFRFEVTIPCEGSARVKGSNTAIPVQLTSNFFGNLNVKADAEMTVTQSNTRISYSAKVENVTITQSGFAFTNEIAKLANSTLRSAVQEAIDKSIKPMVTAQINQSLRDLSSNNSSSIRNLVGITATSSTQGDTSSTPVSGTSYPLPGTWKSGNNTLAVSSDGRFTLYVANTGQKSYYYSYNNVTGSLIAKDVNGKETRITLQWIDRNSFRWTSPNGTRTYRRSN